MKLESSLDRSPALLHLAPLLDVMALMVVFYLLGSSFIHQSGLSAKLPASDGQLPPITDAHVVLVTAGDPPLVIFDRTQMTFDGLLARLKARPEDGHDVIYFKIDKRIPNGTTTEVMNAALLNGYQVYLITEPKAVPPLASKAPPEVAPQTP